MKVSIPCCWSLLLLLFAPTVFGQGANATSASSLMQQARVEFKAKRWEAAGDYYRQAAKLEPTNSHAYAGIGASFKNLKQYDKAAVAFEKAVALDPSYTNIWADLAFCYSIQEKFEKSAKAYQSYVGLNQKNALAYNALGISLIQLDRFEEAKGACQQAIRLNSTNSGFYNNLGYCWQRLNQHNEAVEVFKVALSFNPKSDRAWRNIAGSYYQVKSYQRASDAFQMYLTFQPGDDDAYFWLGRSLVQLDRYQEAEDACRRAVTLNPTNTDYRTTLKYCQEKREDFDKRLKSYQAILSKDPRNTNAWRELGDLYYSVRDKTNALTAYRQYAVLNDKNPKVFYRISWILNLLDRDAEEEEPIRRALALDSTNTVYRMELGDCLYNTRRYDEAAKIYREIISTEPKNAEAHLQVGMCFYFKKAYQEALEPLQRCVSIEPTNFQGWNRLGDSFQKLDRHDEAVTAYRSALQIRPNDFWANCSCGMAFFQLGQFGAAAERFEKAAAVDRKQKWMLRVLFACYLLSADYEKAYRMHPGVFFLVGPLLLATYLAGLAFLLRYSFRLRSKPFPGIGFSLAWLGVFFEGQLALIVCLGLLSLVKISQNPLTAIMLAAVPVVFVAVRVFPHQPWGAPFAWPFKFGPRKVFFYALAGIGLVAVTNVGYEAVYTQIMHQPMPGQDTIPLFTNALQRSPWLGAFTLVVVVPVAEEILFRGLFFGALAGRMRARWAIVLSAFIFALVHLELVYLFPLFCVGCLLGWARWKTGSLGLPILLHVLNNGVALLAL